MMYRIFCESYENFLKTFSEGNYRLEVAKIFDLIVDIEKYNKEKLKKVKNTKNFVILFSL